MNDAIKKYDPQAIDLNILSMYDITAAGKVVSADIWTELWELVIRHINAIDAYCVSIDDIRTNWEKGTEQLNKRLGDFDIKYAALSDSFVHYGKEAPTNEHVKLWLEPVEDVHTGALLTGEDLKKRLPAVVLTDTVLTIDLGKALTLADPKTSLIEQYFAEKDITVLKVVNGDTLLNSTVDKQYTIPKGATVTIVHNRGLGMVDSNNTVKTIYQTTVSLDMPWAVMSYNAGNLSNPLHVNQWYGQYIATIVDTNGVLSNISPQFYRTASMNRVITGQMVKFSVNAWKAKTTGDPVSQGITNLTGIASNSKVDLAPEPSQLAMFFKKGYSFFIENKNTELRAYSIGNTPTEDITMRVTITEVSN